MRCTSWWQYFSLQQWASVQWFLLESQLCSDRVVGLGLDHTLEEIVQGISVVWEGQPQVQQPVAGSVVKHPCLDFLVICVLWSPAGLQRGVCQRLGQFRASQCPTELSGRSQRWPSGSYGRRSRTYELLVGDDPKHHARGWKPGVLYGRDLSSDLADPPIVLLSAFLVLVEFCFSREEPEHISGPMLEHAEQSRCLDLSRHSGGPVMSMQLDVR